MEKLTIEAEALIKKVLTEKSFLTLTEKEKAFLIEFYNDDMKSASKNYEEYLLLSESEKLVDIVVLALKEYIGNWHVSTKEMQEISEYLETISKIK